jgi:hypothetical protein
MTTIRCELDQLRDLTKEFQALKLELAARSQDRSPVKITTRLTTSNDLPAHHAAAVLAFEYQDSPGTDNTAVPVAVHVGADSSLAAPIAAPAASSRVSSAKPMSSTLSSQVPLGGPFPEPSYASSRSGQSETESVHATLGGLNPEADRDVMIWLHQRMMTLQQERETRWQKILKLLPGLS